MIEELDGMKEIVHYTHGSRVRIYHNVQNEGYPLHWHSAIEMIMPIRLGYHVTVQNVEYELDPGDILWITPGSLHSIAYPPEDGERLLILYDPTLMNQLPEMASLFTLLVPCLLVTEEKDLELHNKIHDILIHILTLELADDHYKEAQIYAELIRLNAILGNRLHAKLNSEESAEIQEKIKARNEVPSDAPTNLNIVFESCEYMQANCDKDLSLEDVAERAGFSKYYFSRIFNKYTGMSFLDYLHRCRITEAERYLLDPDLSITEISHKVGFNSHSNFNRVFKKFKDCTPTEFRELASFMGYQGVLSQNPLVETDMQEPSQNSLTNQKTKE